MPWLHKIRSQTQPPCTPEVDQFKISNAYILIVNKLCKGLKTDFVKQIQNNNNTNNIIVSIGLHTAYQQYFSSVADLASTWKSPNISIFQPIFLLYKRDIGCW